MARPSCSIPTARRCRLRSWSRPPTCWRGRASAPCSVHRSDGGYYLLGLKTAHRRLFEDIAWSTERVAAQTLERAREIGLDVHMLPVWYDVDDVEGLRRLHGELGSARRSAPSCDAHAAASSRRDRRC